MATIDTPPSPTQATSEPPKPIHSLVLDTGPLIKNDPPVSVLLAKAEKLYTIPSVIPEIRDAATRSRVETTLMPFVTIRSPRPDSIRFIQGFARRTGDLNVLSRPDLEVLALGYELECERNGGDWRLRNMPGQKRLNGRPGQNEQTEAEAEVEGQKPEEQEEPVQGEPSQEATQEEAQTAETAPAGPSLDEGMQNLNLEQPETKDAEPSTGESKPETASTPQENEPTEAPSQPTDQATPASVEAEADESDSEDGWITPSNLKKHQEADANGPDKASAPAATTLQAAILTSDYAMQNVALRMNLNLVAPSLARITYLKNWVLRCHGCFTVTRDMAKQFCPSCGQPTLLRTSCSTDQHGVFRLHLKKNFQWNNRGNVYSVPKPVHGTPSGKLARNTGGAGGGKNGWGRDLVFAEDQKEYVRAAEDQRRERRRDIMDQDYLPGLMGGDRANAGTKIRVGAGRNVNSRRKR
ncbi:Nin one binding Zn-ribbon like-domain-containing protein [Stachybotrys elegans]|uniref:20S-pre-rRNA D-site endonuclease NOB1 n=1 Tax=Stachybotrys elegans TaxID=80388 RepID=A0A8K0WS37_9HYPO|nr:Nin one binding Zn-ribbon like-domain-containing protein [Stachybotrys elegans]